MLLEGCLCRKPVEAYMHLKHFNGSEGSAQNSLQGTGKDWGETSASNYEIVGNKINWVMPNSHRDRQ